MAVRFIDGITKLNAANLNTLDRGGNVYQDAGGGCYINVSACQYVRAASGTVIAYAGAGKTGMTPSQTNYVYLDTAGALQINTSGFPNYASTPHVPLATVVCSASNITAINDMRNMAFLP